MAKVLGCVAFEEDADIVVMVELRGRCCGR